LVASVIRISFEIYGARHVFLIGFRLAWLYTTPSQILGCAT